MTVQLTEEQHMNIAKVHMAIHSGCKEATLAGAGGTGKTTCALELERRLLASGRVVVWVASTNKAKLRLEEVIGREVKTVHGLTYRSMKTDDSGNPVFTASDVREDAVPENAVVCCDEAGMVGRTLARHLRRALPRGVPIVWIGDPAQLGPVNDIAAPDFDNPTAELLTVHRIALEMESFRIATGIRQKTIHQLPKESKGDYTYHRTGRLLEAADWRFQESGRVLICWTNRTRKALNLMVRSIAGRSNRGQSYAHPVPGELLLMRSTNPQAGCFNGQILELTRIVESEDPREVRVDWEGSGLSWMPRIRLDLFGGSSSDFQQELGLGAQRQNWLHVDWGYALTCHAAQGSEYPHVGIVIDSGAMFAAKKSGSENLRRWLYTALSRAQKSVTVFDCRR